MKTKINDEKQLINALKSLKTYREALPSDNFRANAKIRILNTIAESNPASGSENRPVFALFRKPALRFAGIIAVVFLVLSTGTILAAQSANPKDQLYPVKLATENAVMAALPDSPLKMDVAIAIVKRRAEEINVEKQTASAADVRLGIQRYSQSINNVKNMGKRDNQNIEQKISEDEKNLKNLILKYENPVPNRVDTGHENTTTNEGGNSSSRESVKGESTSSASMTEQNQQNTTEKLQTTKKQDNNSGSSTQSGDVNNPKTTTDNNPPVNSGTNTESPFTNLFRYLFQQDK